MELHLVGQLRPGDGWRLSQDKATFGDGIARVEKCCVSVEVGCIRSRTQLSLRKILLPGRGKASSGGKPLSIHRGKGEGGRVNRAWEAPIRETAKGLLLREGVGLQTSEILTS